MFTGLVETVGRVRAATGHSPRRLTIESSIPTAEVELGASVAIDGCCLTVVEKHSDALSFEAATETLQRTTLGALKAGDRVNLERALRVGDRLGGHLVAGHVDAVGTVAVREKRGSAVYFGITTPWEVLRLTAPRGSITIAGVSLTVTDVTQDACFVGVIPHTMEVTTFGDLQVGAPVNLEADLVARYLERLVTAREGQAPQGAGEGGGLTMEILRSKGFA